MANKIDLLIAKNNELENFLNYILNISEDRGRDGCTYGETDFDSLSAAYGYNTCRENIQDEAQKTLEKLNGLEK